jgi:hypothetical protein
MGIVRNIRQKIKEAMLSLLEDKPLEIEHIVEGKFDLRVKTSEALEELIRQAKKKYNIKISDNTLFGLKSNMHGKEVLHYFEYGKLRKYRDWDVDYYSEDGVLWLICYKNP